MVQSTDDSSDDDVIGNLFVEEEESSPPEYQIETVIIDREVLQSEGKTWPHMTPLYDRFDSPLSSGAVSGLHPASFRIYYRNKRHSLWGHKLWNAAKYLVKRMDQRRIAVEGKTVLELGAGLGLPSLAAYHNGAALVVVTDYPDSDLLEMLQLNVDKNGASIEDALPSMHTEAHPSMAATSTSTSPPLPPTPTRKIVVEPLLWGHEKQMEKVLSYTNGKGFDVIILSDILFNHVCNDDLASTVATMLRWGRTTTPSASSSSTSPPTAYCVFSHHRAYKQVEDLEFFDKIIANGLFYELIDQEDYPMMFPEDRGPEEVRQPVKVYRITRKPPDALVLQQSGQDTPGGVLSTPLFAPLSPCLGKMETKALSEKEAVADVVIQGTSLPQCLLSAALARCGLRVLHCDAAGYYGGGYASLPLRDFIALLTSVSAGTFFSSSRTSQPPKIVMDRLSTIHDPARVHGNGLPTSSDPSSSSSSPLSSCGGTTPQKFSLVGFLIDLLPVTPLTRGEVVQQLLDSSLTHLMEFLFVEQLLLLKVDHKGHPNGSVDVSSSSVQAYDFPFTRAGFFATSHALLSLMDKRRLMQLVKEMNPALVEGHHAVNAPLGEAKMDLDGCTNDVWAEKFVHKCGALYAPPHASLENEKKGSHKDKKASRHHPDGSPDTSEEDVECPLRRVMEETFRLRGTGLDLGSTFGFFDHRCRRGVPPLPRADPAKGNGDDVPHPSSPLSSLYPAWYRSTVLSRQLLTSAHRFGAPTPFLHIKYGIGELAGTMSRVSATHKALFALDRSVQRLAVREVGGDEKLFAVMSNNGQHVETKVVVLPSGPSGRVPLRFDDAEHRLAVEKARDEGTLSSFDVYVPAQDSENGTVAEAPVAGGASFSRVVMITSTSLFQKSNLPRMVNQQENTDPEEAEEEEVVGMAEEDTVEKDGAVPLQEKSVDAPSPPTGSKGNGTTANTPKASASKKDALPPLPPSVMALGRFPIASKKNGVDGASAPSVAVHIVQCSCQTGHVPLHSSTALFYHAGEHLEKKMVVDDPSCLVLLHFTANESDITAEDLYEGVVQTYFVGGCSAKEEVAGISGGREILSTTTTSGNDRRSSASPSVSSSPLDSSFIDKIKEEDILFAAYFTVNEDSLNRFSAPVTFMGDVPSETRQAHEYGIHEKLKADRVKKHQQEILLTTSTSHPSLGEGTEIISLKERLEKANDVSSRCVTMCPSLSDSLMDDSAALLYAKRAFHDVLDKLGIPMEKRNGKQEIGSEKEDEGKSVECNGYQFL